eukprot:4797969-Prymnesium_polylepis.1
MINNVICAIDALGSATSTAETALRLCRPSRRRFQMRLQPGWTHGTHTSRLKVTCRCSLARTRRASCTSSSRRSHDQKVAQQRTNLAGEPVGLATSIDAP